MNQLPTVFERLQQLTGISQEEYSSILFKLGITSAYLFTGDDRAARCITKTKINWSWFQNQFEIIDLQFVNGYLIYGTEDKTLQPALKDLWLNEHNPNRMTSYPNRQVMEAAYCVMIGEANQELIEMEAQK